MRSTGHKRHNHCGFRQSAQHIAEAHLAWLPPGSDIARPSAISPGEGADQPAQLQPHRHGCRCVIDSRVTVYDILGHCDGPVFGYDFT